MTPITVTIGVLGGKAHIIHRGRSYLVLFTMTMTDESAGRWKLEVDRRHVWLLDQDDRGHQITRRKTRTSLVGLLYDELMHHPVFYQCLPIRELVMGGGAA